MKKVILLSMIVVASFGVKAQTNIDSTTKDAKAKTDIQLASQINHITTDSSVSALITQGDRDVMVMQLLTIEGLKAIRHDAILRMKFHYAHCLKLVIRNMEYNLSIKH